MDLVLTRSIQLIGLACSLASHNGLALSLGSIQYNSYLDEPLDASIELLDVEADAETSVVVVPANSAELARLGVKPQSQLATLKTEVLKLASGKIIVRLATTNIISNAQLNVALRAQWQDGAIVQKYTLLLEDPPEQKLLVDNERIYEEAQGELEMLEAEPTKTDVTDSGQSNDNAQHGVGEARVVWNVDSSSINRDQWRVAEGQKLSDIALHLRPANTVSVDQMMVAIANKNSAVLSADLAQELKPGQILQVPSMEEVEKVNRQQAKRSVLLATLSSSGEAANTIRNGVDSSPQEGAGEKQQEATQAGVLRLGTAPASDLPGDTKNRGKKVQGKNFKGSRSDLGRRLDNVLARLDDANMIIGNHRTEIDELNLTIADLSHTIELKNNELAKLLHSVNDTKHTTDHSSLPASPSSTDLTAVEAANDQANDQLGRQDLTQENLEDQLSGEQLENSENTLKTGVLASVAAFFAAIFAALTFARWRHARRQASEYDPLSEEMSMLEKAGEGGLSDGIGEARIVSRDPAAPKPAAAPVEKTTTSKTSANKATKVETKPETKAPNSKASLAKETVAKQAVVRKPAVKAPVAKAVKASDKPSEKGNLLTENKALMEEVANEFDALAPMPWSPPNDKDIASNTRAKTSEAADDDVAVLSKPKTIEKIDAKPAVKVQVKAPATSTAKADAIAKPAAKTSVAKPNSENQPAEKEMESIAAPVTALDLDALLADDFGLDAELDATPLETAQAYLELDDVQAALKVLTEILADESSVEHDGASKLLAKIDT